MNSIFTLNYLKKKEENSLRKAAISKRFRILLFLEENLKLFTMKYF